MPKTIMQKLNDVAAIISQPGGQATAKNVQNKAAAAILKGSKSPEWDAYMSLFAETTGQLNRLTFKDSTKDDFYMNRNVAYIVANGLCGTRTTTNTGANVDPVIDENIPDAPAH